MKQFIIIVILSLVGIKSGYGEKQVSISLWNKNGTCSTFLMKENTVIKFANAELVLSNKSEKLYFPLTEIQRWTYSTVETSIINTKQSRANIEVYDDRIVINNISIGEKIRIYSIDGRLNTVVLSKSATEVINTSSWGVGIYVIKCAEVSFKIQKS